MVTEKIDAEDVRKVADKILERIQECREVVAETDGASKWGAKCGVLAAYISFIESDLVAFKRIHLNEKEPTPDKPTQDPKM